MDSQLDTLMELDAPAMIELLQRDEDPLAVMASYKEFARHLYWKRGDIDRFVQMACAGISFGLSAASSVECADATRAHELRSTVKALCYDLASFTWPGWNQPGIALERFHRACGLDAAKANLRLALELNKGDLPLSRAQWMLAGQHLAAGDWAAAQAGYRAAANHARSAGAAAEDLLSQAFEHLAAWAADDGDSEARDVMLRCCDTLRSLDAGDTFAQQVTTAAQVFCPAGATAPAK